MNDELLELAVDVAREAAALVRDRRRERVEVADTKSSATDVVTEVDRESEALIRGRIRAARPDDGFLGEEGHDEPGSSGVRWIVDPIDGTVNFLYGLAPYAVSIAAERDGAVVAGIVLDVPSGREFTAVVAGDGSVTSRRDGDPIAVREETPLAQRLVGTGFSYVPELRARPGRGDRPAAPGRPRHPSDGILGPRHLFGRRGYLRRVLRGGPARVGLLGGGAGGAGRRGHGGGHPRHQWSGARHVCTRARIPDVSGGCERGGTSPPNGGIGVLGRSFQRHVVGRACGRCS